MPKLSSVLKDLLDVKTFLTILVGLGAVIVAFTKPFGSPELDQIVGFVLAAAAFAITVINAYTRGFTAASRPVPHG